MCFSRKIRNMKMIFEIEAKMQYSMHSICALMLFIYVYV